MGATHLRPGALAVLSAAVVCGPGPAWGAATADISGAWEAPGGLVRIEVTGAHVSGVLERPAPDVALQPGTRILDGSLAEDNLTAEMRLAVVAPRCASVPGDAFVVLLATRSGKLVGGLSSGAVCASGLATLTLQRAAPRTGMAGQPQPGEYDPRSRPKSPREAAVDRLMRSAANYLEEGRVEKARAEFQQAIAHDPLRGEAYNGVGVTYALRFDYETAIEWYKRGLEARPAFGDLYYNLACAYSQEGKSDLALRYLRLAVLRHYTDLENLDKDPDLAPLRASPVFQRLRQGPAAAEGALP